MLSAADVEAAFTRLGGQFVLPAAALATRLESARALVFDWDGVFNSGAKGESTSSTFSEPDSMGINLLRFALWRRDARLPPLAVITGENNASARQFAQREHFDAVYYGARSKGEVLAPFCASHGLDAREVVCVFDDVNDLALAEQCGVRALVRRPSSPLLQRYAERRGLCDYVTAAGSSGNAVREIAELVLGLLGAFETAVESRMRFDDEYARYFSARQAVETALHDCRNREIGA